MTEGFLHLTDADDGHPVRIRISTVDAIYVHDESEPVNTFHGQTVAVREREPFTMIVYGAHGSVHGVRETIDQVECQMADFYELVGIAAAQ